MAEGDTGTESGTGSGSRRQPRRPSLDPASAAIRTALRQQMASIAAAPSSETSRVIVAVSGGADSMALLHACAFLHRRGEVDARAVTVDHGLQEASPQVAARVVSIAESWGVPAEVAAITVSAGDEGIEAAARDARYAALESARIVHGADWILTAHTQSDQAETVLLGLMRGSGTRSLAGMSPVTGRVVRPLLGLERAMTAASCRAQGVEVWHDPMNANGAFARVRARRLLATLETDLGQPITANLARTADLCRADADFLERSAEAVAVEVRGATDIALESLLDLDDAILSRVVREWLVSVGVPAQNVGAARVAELCALIRAQAGSAGGASDRGDSGRGARERLSLPGDTEAVVGRGRLLFQLAAKAR